MRILYFTSTGNCLYVAKKIGGELLSIPQLQKNNIYEINDDVVGIITPIYAWNIPRLVQHYLKNVKINAKYVFVLMTYGYVAMGAVSKIYKLLKNNNTQIHYANIIKMIDNYLPIFDISNEIKNKNVNDMDIKISFIINDINSRRYYIQKQCIFKTILSNIYSSYFLSSKYLKNAIKNFYVNDKCNGCNVCRKICPVGNIIGLQKPEFSTRCEFCLACIHNCPMNAIHLKNERSEERFINENIALSEIIEANIQI